MSMPKWDFYQTETHVTLTILKRGVVLEQCRVEYDDEVVTVLANGEPIFQAQLEHPVDPATFQLKCTPSKVEVKMAKLIGQHWETFEKKTDNQEQKKASLVNWDKFAKEVDEEEENVEGDAAVNRMFQKIYADADDDVKKAMLKSYTESGGTVLSTNWNEIKKKRTEIKPPEGMEYKRWND
uniref:Suppressor of G2 allele of SKP1 n=1 Tax=Ascaris suum TaxID=6253 RepID=F1L635_ASCSU